MNIIEAKGISKKNILHGMDFAMKEGEMVAIMGPSGSGKSTFLYMLSGMDSFDDGKLTFCGRDITEYGEDEFAKLRLEEMGFVFQQMNMISNLNIIDNIILPAVQSQRHLEKSKRKSEEQLKEKALSLMKTMGIEELQSRQITEVSGGQLQRACICRAMMNNPKVILADEPTGALNRSAADDVMDEFIRLNREGMSILIVTHDEKVASRCNRVLYIVDGQFSEERI